MQHTIDETWAHIRRCRVRALVRISPDTLSFLFGDGSMIDGRINYAPDAHVGSPDLANAVKEFEFDTEELANLVNQGFEVIPLDLDPSVRKKVTLDVATKSIADYMENHTGAKLISACSGFMNRHEITDREPTYNAEQLANNVAQEAKKRRNKKPARR